MRPNWFNIHNPVPRWVIYSCITICVKAIHFPPDDRTTDIESNLLSYYLDIQTKSLHKIGTY